MLSQKGRSCSHKMYEVPEGHGIRQNWSRIPGGPAGGTAHECRRVLLSCYLALAVAQPRARPLERRAGAMIPDRRLGAILGAYAISAVVPPLILLLIDWISFGPGRAEDDMSPLEFVLVGWFMTFLAAVLPAALCVKCAETFGLRRLWNYAVAGGATGFVAFPFPITVSPLRVSLDTEGALLLATCGIVAGTTCWSIAGRNAGLWKNAAMAAMK